jgi:hypothetical protein
MHPRPSRACESPSAERRKAFDPAWVPSAARGTSLSKKGGLRVGRTHWSMHNGGPASISPIDRALPALSRSPARCTPFRRHLPRRAPGFGSVAHSGNASCAAAASFSSCNNARKRWTTLCGVSETRRAPRATDSSASVPAGARRGVALSVTLASALMSALVVGRARSMAGGPITHRASSACQGRRPHHSSRFIGLSVNPHRRLLLGVSRPRIPAESRPEII